MIRFQPEPPIRLTAGSAMPILSTLNALVCSASFAFSAVKKLSGLVL
jgi:hypothetical protein